ncbi:VCBS repeat-containing protein, partial [Candidatus Uhrbacteria bacterium]|nr:VCBS repeat-containing protein [Candidatus Uhrbacteria bacterium]
MRKPSFYSLIKKTTYGIAVLSILFSILSILYFFPDSAWAHPYLDALNYITGGRPSAVFIDDFDNDGNKDMAVANNITSWNLWILRNNGNGTFSSPTPYGLGTCGGRDVKGADFNSDGNKDLAISCGSAVRVVLGNGD